MKQQKLVWLLTGLVVGVGVAQFWPHEPVAAGTSDRGSKFGMVTCAVSLDGVEGVFVIDYLTGQLKGKMINPRAGKFVNAYYRNLAADFNVDPKAEPHYVMVSGNSGQTIGQRGFASSTGTIYIGELTSGKIVAYTLPYKEGVAAPLEMRPLDTFQFREPVVRD